MSIKLSLVESSVLYNIAKYYCTVTHNGVRCTKAVISPKTEPFFERNIRCATIDKLLKLELVELIQEHVIVPTLAGQDYLKQQIELHGTINSEPFIDYGTIAFQ